MNVDGPMGAPGPAGPGQPQKPPAVTSNEEYIWDYLVGQGFSPAQTAGIMGNLQQESGFNPESIQQGGPGRGIAQWSQGGRWQPGLMTGNVGTDLQNQLNFMLSELKGNKGYGLQSLLQATTPQQAAQIFGSDFERYGIAGARVGDAANIYKAAMNPNSGYAQNQQQGQAAVNAGPYSGALGGQLGQLGANQSLSNFGTDLATSGAFAQNSLTNQQLQQQLQNTLASLGLQKTGLGQQGQYEQGTFGLQQQGIQEALANLAAQYGFQQQQFGLQGQEAQQAFQNTGTDIASQGAATGTYNTGTQRTGQARNLQQFQNAMQQLGIQQGQAGQAYQYGQQGEQNQLAQLGLTNTYQQQQLQNALQQLGLQQTEAQQGYGLGVEQSQQSLANTLAGLAMQTGATENQTLQGGIGQFSTLFGAASGGY